MEHKCDVFNYADDNNLSYHHNDPQMIKSVLEDAAKVAIEWFAENKMKANPSKFQAILLCRKPVSMSFHIGDAEIMPTNCVKLLGVHIDDKLSFAEHVTYLCKKTAKQLNAMSRLRNILSKETKHNIFNSFIVSNFNYCPLVYHVCGIGSTSKMERILQRGIRLIYMLWNMLLNVCKALPFNDFKSYIQQWDGPICCGQCHLCFTLVKH